MFKDSDLDIYYINVYKCDGCVLTDTNDCAATPCQHGTCTDQVDAYTCSCDAGYEGTDCDVGKLKLLF